MIFNLFCYHEYKLYKVDYYIDYQGYRIQRRWYICKKCGKKKITKWF